MPTTEIPTKPGRGLYMAPSPPFSLGRTRSGYEPSDTESEWHDSPWHEAAGDGASADRTAPPRSTSTPPDVGRRAITPTISQRHGESCASLVRTSRKTSPLPRRHSRLPHEPAAELQESGGDGKNYSDHDNQRRVTPYRAMTRAESRDLRGRDDADNGSFRRRTPRMTPPKFRDTMAADDAGAGDHFQQVPMVSEMPSSYRSRRSKSAPKQRDQPPLQLQPQPQQQPAHVNSARRQGRSPSPLGKPQASVGQTQNPSASEISEITESAALGIFFSQHCRAVKKSPTIENGCSGGGACPTPSLASDRASNAKLEQQRSDRSGGANQKAQMVSVSSAALSRTDTTRSFKSAVSRHSSGGLSNDTSRTSDGSGSFRKFAANRQKIRSQQDECGAPRPAEDPPGGVAW